jgi:small subunit ribosomal protein S11
MSIENVQRRSRKKSKSQVSHGQAHITAKFNNTIVTITDAQGNVISWSSAGACGFKGSRKGTPFAAQVAAEKAAKAAKERGLAFIVIYVQGAGSGREAAIRVFKLCDITVEQIYDVTPIPHNGCRQSKKRRV